MLNHPIISKLSKKDLVRLIEAYQIATQKTIFCSITDANGVITYANEMFCKTSKYSEEELIGKTHNIVNAGYHSTEYFKEMWDTITSGRPWHGELKNRAKDGTYYWLDSVIVPMKDDNNVITNYFSLRMLITEKKQALEDRTKYISQLEDMLFIISHKMRHSISNILSLITLLEDYANNPDEILKMAGYLKDSALILDGVTSELSGFISTIEQKNKERQQP